MPFRDWPLWLKLISIGSIAIVLGVGLWMALRDVLCANESGWQLKYPTRGACFEFWVNRYQTTIQTVLSSMIGIAGLYFIVRQLKGLNVQNEMTRLALDANTKQYRATQLSLVGRARVALAKFAGGAGLLMGEGIRVLAKQPWKDPDSEFINSVNASLADIYPILSTTALSAEWRELKSEYDTLSAYIFMMRVYPNVDETMLQVNLQNCPRDMIEATARASALSVRFHSFAEKIDL